MLPTSHRSFHKYFTYSYIRTDTSARPPPNLPTRRPAEQSGKIKSSRNSLSLGPHWDTVCNTVTLTSNKTECLVALEEAVDLEVGKEAVGEEGGVVALGVGTAAAAEEGVAGTAVAGAVAVAEEAAGACLRARPIPL